MYGIDYVQFLSKDCLWGTVRCVQSPLSPGQEHPAPAVEEQVDGGWCLLRKNIEMCTVTVSFFSRIANTIVLKSGILEAGVRIKMGDAPRRGASCHIDPSSTLTLKALGQGSLRNEIQCRK